MTNLIKQVVEENFNEIGNKFFTEKSIRQFKQGFFWNWNLNEYLNDEEIIITKEKITEIYISEIVEIMESEDIEEPTTDEIQSAFLALWENEETFVDYNSTKETLEIFLEKK